MSAPLKIANSAAIETTHPCAIARTAPDPSNKSGLGQTSTGHPDQFLLWPEWFRYWPDAPAMPATRALAPDGQFGQRA